MTDKPNTLTLSIDEAKSLAITRIHHLTDGIVQMVDHLQKQPAINKQMIGELNEYWSRATAAIGKQWDDIQLPLQLWERLSRPVIAEYEARQVAERKMAEQPAQAMLEPHPIDVAGRERAADEKPKRKGGWPAGKPRKPKPNSQTSADVLPPVTQ